MLDVSRHTKYVENFTFMRIPSTCVRSHVTLLLPSAMCREPAQKRSLRSPRHLLDLCLSHVQQTR